MEEELQSTLHFSSPSVGASSISISPNETIKEKIKLLIQRLDHLDFSPDMLFQFWAPVRIADKVYLTCVDQPFTLDPRIKGLCSYRRLCLCLENMLIPVGDVHKLGSEEYHLGPVGRAFRHGYRESCGNISYYLIEEYSHRDNALQLGLKSYMALPLFESAGFPCIGVLEIASIRECVIFPYLKYLNDKLELGNDLPCRHHDSEDSEAEAEALRVLDGAFRRHHQLRYAQIWAVHLDKRRRKVIGTVDDDDDLYWLKMCEGEGVLGKAISSEGACFCQDVSNLSINVLPWVPLARQFGLSGSFAICLKSSRVNAFYILELFFLSEIEFGDTKTFLRKLVAELKKDIEKIENSPFQEIEERLSVEVIKISSEYDEIDSFEICTTGPPPSPFDHLGQGAMMQHELSMEMEANEECFSWGDEVCNFMPYQLSYLVPAGANYPWVFWSSEDNELQSILRSSYTSVCASSISQNKTIKEKIKLFLQRLHNSWYLASDALVQFWAPVKMADKVYLTCADQPFALNELVKGLFSYRRLCLYPKNIVIPVDDVHESGSEEHHLSPLGRAFRHQSPELCGNIRYYLTKEYPQRDSTLQLGLPIYVALPLFESIDLHCIGVLEIVSKYRDGNLFWYLQNLNDKLEVLGLRSKANPVPHGISSCLDSEAAEKARRVMYHTFPCYHELLRAHMWAARLDNTCISLICCDHYTAEFIRPPLRKGQGVVGKAFSSLGACFCKDVTKLSINELPWVPLARRLRYSGCFAICLKSSRFDEFYILEFLFRNRIDYGDPKTFLAKLVAGLKKDIERLENSPIQAIGEKLFVEVIEVSTDQNELESFEICTARSPRQDEMMQHDSSHPQVDETNDARPHMDCAIQTVALGPNQEGGLTETGGSNQEGRLAETGESNQEGRLNETGVSNQEGRLTETGESNQEGRLNETGGSNREGRLTETGGSNQEGRLTETGGARIKFTEIRTLAAEYEITPEVLQQHSRKKLQDAAKALGVSRSTLKRTCRKYGFKRWPPKRSKGPNDSCIHQKSVHSAANENTDAHNTPNSRKVEDGGSVIVKATYGEDTFKFQFSLSAKKTDLEQQVATRLNPSVRSFRIKYLDEENEWVSVTCDEDLKLCIDTCKLLGKTTIRMSIS